MPWLHLRRRRTRNRRYVHVLYSYLGETAVDVCVHVAGRSLQWFVAHGTVDSLGSSAATADCNMTNRNVLHTTEKLSSSGSSTDVLFYSELQEREK